MTGDMEIVLKLSDAELYQALGQSIFFECKPTEEQIWKEFWGFKKIEVPAISADGEEGKALIFVQDVDKDTRNIIVVAEKGYSIDCRDYFFVSKDLVRRAPLGLVKEVSGFDTAELLNDKGQKFPSRHSMSQQRTLIMDYQKSPNSLSLEVVANYKELGVDDQAYEEVPFIVKFGHTEQAHSMRLDLVKGIMFRVGVQVSITCVPARNIANLVGK